MPLARIKLAGISAFIGKTEVLAFFRRHPITEVVASGNLIFYRSAPQKLSDFK